MDSTESHKKANEMGRSWQWTMTPEYQARFMQTALQRHCAFFDRDRDGILSLQDTFSGLRVLGFNILFAAAMTLLIHLSFSYLSSPSWIPSLSLSIHLANIDRCRHGSTLKAYTHSGDLHPQPVVLAALDRFDFGHKGGLSAWELGWMLWGIRDAFDWFGWLVSAVWWMALYMLAADPKTRLLSKEAVLAQYDGSLFYAIEEQRKAAAELKKSKKA